MPHSVRILLCAVLVFVSFSLFSCSDDNPVKPDPEPVENPLALSMNRTDWHMSSKPPVLDDTWARGKMLWHTPRDMVPYDQVYGYDIAVGQSTVRTFRMIFRPGYSAVDNGMTPPETSYVSNSWGGITTAIWEDDLSGAGYLQLRARASEGLVVHFDFGKVSEDLDSDGLAFSEDVNGNGAVDEEEDVGLDGLPDSLEPGYDPVENPDAHGDNWFFMGEGKCPLPADQCEQVNWDDESICYEWLNGTEGNLQDPCAAGSPDQESITNYRFEREESHASYRVDFAQEDFMVPGSKRLFGWATYRIPLFNRDAADAIVGKCSAHEILLYKRLRIWFEKRSNLQTEDTLEIADWGFKKCPENITYVRDYEYVEGRVFDLGREGEFGPDDTVTHLLIYQFGRGYTDSLYPAAIYVDPDDTAAYASENITDLRVTAMAPDEYEFYNDHAHGRHFVVLDTSVYRRHPIGVFMTVSRAGSVVPDTIGDISGDTLKLKMLQHYSPDESLAVWDLMWRNCYSIPKGLSLDDVDIDVFYGLPGTEDLDTSAYRQDFGGETVDYITILGLDQYNVQDQRIPDGRVDDRVDVFRPDWGLLIFPHREPFASDTTFEGSEGHRTPLLSEQIPALYGDDTSARAEASRYYIRLETDTP